MDVSSAHWQESKEKGPPSTMSSLGTKHRAPGDLRVVPRTLLAAGPIRHPWKRACLSISAVR